MTAFPSPVLAAAVLAAEGASFLLVGSAALWLRDEIDRVADADVVIEPSEPSVRRLRGALGRIAIGPVPSVGRLSCGSIVTVMTGYGQVVEIELLEALEATQFVKSATALARVEERIGLAPGYAYEILLDLARPWVMPVNLVQGQGNFGSRGDDPAANFRYTEARISPAGRVALAAERGEMSPLPIALINGNTHREGLRPPFRPQAIIDAVREAVRRPDVTDAELTGLVGLCRTS